MGYYMEVRCSSLYLLSIAHVHIVPTSTPCVQSGTHIISTCLDSTPYLYSPCPVCTPSLQPQARQYPNVFNPSLVTIIFTAYVERLYHLYITTPERTPSLQHLYLPYLVSNSIYCPFTVRTPSLMSMSNPYTTLPVHVQLVHHLLCT